MSRFRTSIPSLIATVLAIATFAGGQTGIPQKRPVFGGACRLCPWGAMAEVVQTAMKPYGYDVQICYNCNAADAPRIVSEARVPPPYRPDPAVPEILAPRNAPGLGTIDFGAVAIQFLRNAYRGTGPYAREKPRTNLRLIANIQDPSYVLVAAKRRRALPTCRRSARSAGRSESSQRESAATPLGYWLTSDCRNRKSRRPAAASAGERRTGRISTSPLAEAAA